MNKEHYIIDSSFPCSYCYKSPKKNLKNRAVVLRCGHLVCRGCEKKQGGRVPKCPSCGLENVHRGITPFFNKDSHLFSEIRLQRSEVLSWIEKLTLKEQNNQKRLRNKLEYFNHALHRMNLNGEGDAHPDFRTRTTDNTCNTFTEIPLPTKSVNIVDIYTHIHFRWTVCNAHGLRIAYNIRPNKLVLILPDKTTKVFVLPGTYIHIHQMAFIKNSPTLIVTVFTHLMGSSPMESKYFIINYEKGEIKEGGFYLDAYVMNIYDVVDVKHKIGLTFIDYNSQRIVYYELNENMEIVGDMLYFQNYCVDFLVLAERTILLDIDNILYFVTFEEGGNQYIEINDLVCENVIQKIKKGDVVGLMGVCYTYNFKLKKNTLELEEKKYNRNEERPFYAFRIIHKEKSTLVSIDLFDYIEEGENNKMVIFYTVKMNEEEVTFKISSCSFVDDYYLQMLKRDSIIYENYYYFNRRLYCLLEIRVNDFDGYLLKNMEGGKDIVFYDSKKGRMSLVYENMLNVFGNLIVKEERNRLIFYELDSSKLD
eukprot:GAHX01001221.1.p1 GENE.GAHX01001221.1~~GAHX01001221.1.p1  ORF type:complete len:549 (-),score=67.81 GAHX01001221.1:72-1679(-)